VPKLEEEIDRDSEAESDQQIALGLCRILRLPQLINERPT
jgi:hypothetical protein